MQTDAVKGPKGATMERDSSTVERDIRTRLMEGLYALENSDHASDFRTAFYFLRLYVAGSGDQGDAELGHAFARVLKAIGHRSLP